MTVLVKSLGDGQLAATTGDLYVAPTATQTVIESIKLVNTHSSAITVNIYLLPSGGSTRRIVSKDLSLAAGYSVEALDKPVTLSAGDKIQGVASAATVVDYVISGVDTSGGGDTAETFISQTDTPDAHVAHKFLVGNSAGTACEYDAMADTDYFLDEDDMASDSASKVASQQSIKAYIDGKTGNFDFESTPSDHDLHEYDAASSEFKNKQVSELDSFKDEDNMASNSAAAIASQQSIKAYADGKTTTHEAAGDPHTGYRLESADHNHQSTGAQAGKLDHGAALDGLTDDDHTQYIKHSLATAASDFLAASGAGVFVKKTLAEVKTILGLGSAAYTAATDYVTHALATAANDFLVASGSGAYVKKTLAETLTILGKAAASGLASLNASTKVVEQPASISDHLDDTAGGVDAETTKASTANVVYDINTVVNAHHDRHDPADGADALDCAAPSELASVQAAGEGSAHEFARADHAHQIQESMADNHLVTINQADVAENDYAKFTATGGLSGKSYAEVLADISPLTTRGDIMFRNATVSTRLAKGAQYTKLAMGADDPEWVAGGIYKEASANFVYNLIGVSIGPRAATVSSISTDTITLTANEAYRFWELNMDDYSYLKIANTTKTPDEYAWVKSTPAVNQLQVTVAADIAGWALNDVLTTSYDGEGGSFYHDLDISPVVTDTAPVAVILACDIIDTGTIVANRGLYVQSEAGGPTTSIKLQVSGINVTGLLFVKIDSDRIIRVWDRAVGADAFSGSIQVVGWFI